MKKAVCNGLLIDENAFITVDELLTLSTSQDVGEAISACGLMLDSNVFKTVKAENRRNLVITSAEHQEGDAIYPFLPSCNGVLVDATYFVLDDNNALTTRVGKIVGFNVDVPNAVITFADNGTIIEAIGGYDNVFPMENADVEYTYQINAVGYETAIGTVSGATNQVIDVEMKKIIFATFNIDEVVHPNVVIEVKEGEEVVVPTERATVYALTEGVAYTWMATDVDTAQEATGVIVAGKADIEITPTFA